MPQDAAARAAPAQHGKDTPLRSARTLASRASSRASAWHRRCDHPRHVRQVPARARARMQRRRVEGSGILITGAR